MANDLSTNPIIIDTAMATPYLAGLGGSGPWVRVQNAIWTNQAAAGDRLVIKNNAGKILVDIKAPAANTPVIIQELGMVNGLQVTTIAAGSLLTVYI